MESFHTWKRKVFPIFVYKLPLIFCEIHGRLLIQGNVSKGYPYILSIIKSLIFCKIKGRLFIHENVKFSVLSFISTLISFLSFFHNQRTNNKKKNNKKKNKHVNVKVFFLFFEFKCTSFHFQETFAIDELCWFFLSSLNVLPLIAKWQKVKSTNKWFH